MTEEDLLLFKILLENEKEEVFVLNSYLEKTASIIIQFTETLAKEKVQLKRHEDNYETHYYKFVLQTLSLKHLFDGTPLNVINKDLKLHDISSIYTLTRTTIETFLTINYLYYNVTDTDRLEFRYMYYVASGINSRLKLPANEEVSKKMKEYDHLQLQNITKDIEANLYFQKCHINKRNYWIKEYKAKEIGWNKVMVESGLDEAIFNAIWSLYSNYAHSEYIEVMQIKEYLKSKEVFNSTIYGTLRLIVMLNSYQIIKMIEKFECLKTSFNNLDNDIKKRIILWDGMLRKMKF